jgi:NADPH-dependent curcumin reductase CurA
MDPLRSYVEPLKGRRSHAGRHRRRVVDSRAETCPRALVAAASGWQSHGSSKATVRVVDLSLGRLLPRQVLGMTDVTRITACSRWAGQPGETVVVTAASGAVGGIVGQIAKIKGAASSASRAAEVPASWSMSSALTSASTIALFRLWGNWRLWRREVPVNVLFENVGGNLRCRVAADC